MEIKLGKVGFGLQPGAALRIQGEDVERAALTASKPSEPAVVADVKSPAPTLTASNIKSITDLVSDAAKAIADVRSQQEAIADEVHYGPVQTGRSEALNSQVLTL